ncbi:TetR/AcrR family transcriptional regulator [Mycobacterium sp. ACS4331]|uniref:TetR/AcrR family transcriptional regulator n=1 Tax=Mycobacterium sp. ACS4331 TaxID=1834121 RepID=UPI0018D345F6|nr:TetR/AcrR family transcriptional regulator [Mycobacterium sp. ACS4331]
MPVELVDAALRASEETGRAVAEVPITLIARHAGISRSTLLRRLGGSRRALDQAVCAHGVDPGGRLPVRIRAVDAAAQLIGENGLAAATLDAVAARAGCSVPSIHAIFGTRDGLLRAVFERHSPVQDVEEFLAQPHGELSETVREFYQVIAAALGRAPRVVGAMFGEAFARPTSPAVQALAGHGAPRMLALLGQWLTGEIQAGRIRDEPILLLVQQLMAPMLVHALMRPVAEKIAPAELPELDTVCVVFAENFVRAVGTRQREDHP